MAVSLALRDGARLAGTAWSTKGWEKDMGEIKRAIELVAYIKGCTTADLPADVFDAAHELAEIVERLLPAGAVPTEPEVRKRYTSHNDDLGKWCRFSMVSAPAEAKPEDHCPFDCSHSAVEDDDRRDPFSVLTVEDVEELAERRAARVIPAEGETQRGEQRASFGGA